MTVVTLLPFLCSTSSMLPWLRSTTSRSLLHQSRRSLSSAQATTGTNQAVLNDAMSTFSLQSLTDPEESVERKPVPFSQIEVLPAQDPLLEFFASRLMWRGKRARAEKVTSEILLHINALTKAPPLPVLRQAVDFAAPAVRVVSHKRGGKMIEKPMALNERQRMRRGIDWILGESDKRPGYTRGERIARECIRIIQGSSSVLETKEKEHKRAMICRGNIPRIF